MKSLKTSFKKPILLIDFDGTMYPERGERFRSFLPGIAKKYNISQTQFNRIQEETKEKHHIGVWNLLLHMSNFDFQLFDKMCHEIFDNIDYNDVEPNKKLYKKLQSISDKYDLYCSTNNHKLHVDKGCKKMFGKGLDDNLCFKTLDITSTYKDGCFWPKHVPGAMNIIAELVHSEPQNCTLVDDTPRNIESAEKANMKTVLITENYSLSDYLDSIMCE